MKHIPDTLYKEILKTTVIICVDVYIYNTKTKTFLLAKRNNNPEKDTYCCPGGRIQKGERLFDAAGRQMMRELGLKIKKNKLQLLGLTDTFFEKSAFKNVSTHTMNISMLYFTSQDLSVKLSADSSSYAWKKGGEKDVTPYVRHAIRDIKKYALEKDSMHTLYTIF